MTYLFRDVSPLLSIGLLFQTGGREETGLYLTETCHEYEMDRSETGMKIRTPMYYFYSNDE